MSGRLDRKAILVTGAAGAIGSATARQLANDGARLILADRVVAPMETLAADLPASASAAFVCYDANSPQDCTRLVADAVRLAGRLDGVCNVAGAYTKAHSTQVTDADWAESLQVNLSSAFTISREAIPHLERTNGCVVSTSSLAALDGLAYSTAYAVAKAGIIAMTKSLAAEFAGAGIRFNAICPGGIRSNMSGLPLMSDADPELAPRRSKLKGFGGYGEGRDVAAAFAYLLSDDARYVSGSVLVVDGAQHLV